MGTLGRRVSLRAGNTHNSNSWGKGERVNPFHLCGKREDEGPRRLCVVTLGEGKEEDLDLLMDRERKGENEIKKGESANTITSHSHLQEGKKGRRWY